MSKIFNWETAEYPCFGVAADEVVWFSEYGVGHVTQQYFALRKKGYFSTTWNMAFFKPYTPPKPKTKLWYWEIMDVDGDWTMYIHRMSEAEIQKVLGNGYKKLEALGFIEVEE